MDGRLVDEEGRFIAYRSEEGKKNKDPKEVYFVNMDGEEVVSVTNDEGEEEWVRISLKERKPFLDDEDKPIECSDASSEAPKTKRKRKTTKTT